MVKTYLGAALGADGPPAQLAIVPPRAENRKSRFATHKTHL